jgi:hypothetical protein
MAISSIVATEISLIPTLSPTSPNVPSGLRGCSISSFSPRMVGGQACADAAGSALGERRPKVASSLKAMFNATRQYNELLTRFLVLFTTKQPRFPAPFQCLPRQS